MKGRKMPKSKKIAIEKALVEGYCTMTEIAQELNVSRFIVSVINQKLKEKDSDRPSS